MSSEQLTIYPGYNASPPELPPRSRLYRLVPVGVGTPFIESLTGYAARLADAHCVTPAALFGRELVPLIADKWLRTERPNRSMILASKLRPLARAMNGAGVTAADWVRVVGDATAQRGLERLTMLTWRGVLSQRRLLRPTLAWCPACFGAWREQGHVVYEPLLWSLAVVGACPDHRLRLRTACTHCGRQPFHLESHSLPGFCPACGNWLGLPPGEAATKGEWLTDKELSWQARVTAVVGELLAAAPTLCRRPEKEMVARSALAFVARATASEKALETSDAQRLPKQTVGNWRRGESVPQLDTLTQYCLSARVSLLDFVTGRTGESAQAEHLPPAGRRSAQLRPQAPHQRRSIDRRRDGRTLMAALRKNPPRSLVEVARGMGRQPSALKYQFPDQCAAIVARYEEHRNRSRLEVWGVAKQALEAALQDEPYPNVPEVARRIGWGYSRLVRRFPELCRAVASRHAKYQKKRWLKVEEFLNAALEEEPPPSMVEVVLRSGYSEAILYSRFPATCRQIGARHLAYRHELFGKRRDAFAADVRRVALEIYSEDLYPSVARVQARLPGDKSLRSSKVGLRALSALREELGLNTRAASDTRF